MWFQWKEGNNREWGLSLLRKQGIGHDEIECAQIFFPPLSANGGKLGHPHIYWIVGQYHKSVGSADFFLNVMCIGTLNLTDILINIF